MARQVVPSRYNFVTESLIKDRVIVYNSRTGSMLEIDEGSAKIVSEARAGKWFNGTGDADLDARLERAGCVIPSGFVELADIAAQRRADKSSERGLSVTIAPTMQCNFRCTYCFEEHRQEFMSAEVENALMAFLNERLQSAPYLAVTWFGGEPLLALDTVIRVQRFLKERTAVLKRSLSTSMITNAFLLTRDVAVRLAELGPWEYLQVTVDGHPLIHDTRRKLVSGGGTWSRIVRNVASAVEVGLPITIRMNVDAQTPFDYTGIVRDLHAAGVLPGATVYLGHVTDATPECSHVAAQMLSRKAFARAQLDLRMAMMELGFATGGELPKPKCTLCTADNPNGYVIAPSGRVFKCWNEVHLPESKASGHLLKARTAEMDENLARWDAYDPLNKGECRECRALPVCMGGCPWEAERINAAHGQCGEFKFYPSETLQLAHFEQTIKNHLKTPG